MQKLSPFHLKLNVQTLDKQLKHVPSNISKTMIYSANYKLSLYSKVSLLRPLDVKMLMVILLDGDITWWWYYLQNFTVYIYILTAVGLALANT